jgi:hypothetical protein
MPEELDPFHHPNLRDAIGLRWLCETFGQNDGSPIDASLLETTEIDRFGRIALTIRYS